MQEPVSGAGGMVEPALIFLAGFTTATVIWVLMHHLDKRYPRALNISLFSITAVIFIYMLGRYIATS